MRSVQRIVSDTSPLISLEKIDGGCGFIRQLYDTVLVPPAVLRELAAGSFDNEEAYLSHYGIRGLIQVEEPENSERNETAHLDPGGREAIALAKEYDLPLLIEEEAGRAVARKLDIRISGIAGQILRAVREETLGGPEARRMLADLKEGGRINQQVFESVTAAVDERALQLRSSEVLARENRHFPLRCRSAGNSRNRTFSRPAQVSSAVMWDATASRLVGTLRKSLHQPSPSCYVHKDARPAY